MTVTNFCFLTAFFLFLLRPDITVAGAREGLTLWYTVLLPTLLPCLLLSHILLQTGGFYEISKLLYPVFRKLFRVSRAGSFAVLTGFLCGSPVGAKITVHLVKEHAISKNEGQYLLSFINNPSPMFLISYLLQGKLQRHEPVALWLPVALFFLAPILASFLFRHRYPFLKEGNHFCFLSKRSTLSPVLDSFFTMLLIGGYLTLFSVLLRFLTPLLVFSKYSFPVAFLLSNLELTFGINTLCVLPCFFGHPKELLLTTMLLASLGGLCIFLQIHSILEESELSIKPCLIEKPITAGVTGLLFLCYGLLL